MSEQTSGQVAGHVAGRAGAEMTGQVPQPLLEVENLTVALRTSPRDPQGRRRYLVLDRPGRDPRDRRGERLREDADCVVAARFVAYRCPYVGPRAIRRQRTARA